MCSPCTVQYDFLGSVETIVEDSRYLISHKLRSRGYTKIPTMHPSKSRGNRKDNKFLNKDEEENYLRPLEPYSQVNNNLFWNVMERYGIDMDMFGYTYKRDAQTGIVNATCLTNKCDG